MRMLSIISVILLTVFVAVGCLEESVDPNPPPSPNEPTVVIKNWVTIDPDISLSLMTDFKDLETDEFGRTIFEFEPFDVTLSIDQVPGDPNRKIKEVIDKEANWWIVQIFKANGHEWAKYIQYHDGKWFVGYFTAKYDFENNFFSLIDIYYVLENAPADLKDKLDNNQGEELSKEYLEELEKRVRIIY